MTDPSPGIIMMDLIPRSKWRTSIWIKDDGPLAEVKTTDLYLELMDLYSGTRWR
jgi:hypothetical protein